MTTTRYGAQLQIMADRMQLLYNTIGPVAEALTSIERVLRSMQTQLDTNTAKVAQVQADLEPITRALAVAFIAQITPSGEIAVDKVVADTD